MMTNVNRIRKQWETERPVYEALCQHMGQRLTKLVHAKGIHARITWREKDTTSLLKKAFRKSYVDYEQIRDKAGVRAVVNFGWQVNAVDQMIHEQFQVLDRDDKAETMPVNEFGYQAIHYQVALDDTDNPDFKAKSCELQLRTICQDTWSEMAHTLCYKSDLDVPKQLLRQMNSLSALLELADRTFSQVDDTVRNLPEQLSIQVLHQLEPFYYQWVGTTYDKNLSLEVIECLKHLYTGDELNNLDEMVTRFLGHYSEKVKKLIYMYKNRLLFITQPEIFLIIERLTVDPYMLQEAWLDKFPMEELENIATAWGRPMSQ